MKVKNIKKNIRKTFIVEEIGTKEEEAEKYRLKQLKKNKEKK